MTPADVKALIPAEVVDFYKNLTTGDKPIIKEPSQKDKEFKNEEEAVDTLSFTTSSKSRSTLWTPTPRSSPPTPSPSPHRPLGR
uniref:Skp1_POZ domain-containing protein n=1 Tax=Steinernema glaseri TaxID=37863 RepID=A0A1I7ZPZ6_9BILA